jgi:hypothetical protein
VLRFRISHHFAAPSPEGRVAPKALGRRLINPQIRVSP